MMDNQPILDAVQGDLGSGQIITGFVVVATCIDESGEPTTYIQVMDTQPRAMTLGLLDWAVTHQRAYITQMVFEDPA